MGNEASQEGEGAGPQQPQQQQPRPAPPLITQQSMPLPVSQPIPPESPPGSRRGSAGPQLMMRRTSSAGAGPKRGSIVEVVPPELDLSNLSEEEKATILSVMARAQSMEEEPPPPTVTKEEELLKPEPEKEPEKCSLCRASPKEGSCVECGALCCRKCSKPIPSGKKHVWMCVRCVDRYPQLLPTIHKQEANESEEEVVVDKRRRASEVASHPPEKMQQLPPARGRSDSLPSQKQPRMQQRSQGGPQQRPHGPEMMQGAPRPQTLQQNAVSRPQHPQQQVRPRYPPDPSKGPPQGNGQPRPPHPNEQQRFPHPNGQQRFPHPNGQLKSQQHPAEQRERQQVLDQQNLKQQQMGDKQRQFPADLSKSQLPIDHSAEMKNQNNLDQRNQQASQQHRNHSLDQQRNQNALNNQRNQTSNERKTNSLEHKNQHDYAKPPNSVEQQRPLHPSDPRQQYPADFQRPQHTIDQQRFQPPMDQPRPQHPMDQPPRPQHPNDQIRPKHPMDPFGPQPLAEQQKNQYPVDQRNHQIVDQRSQHPALLQHDQQRMQPSVDQKPLHANNTQGPVQKPPYDEYQNSHHPQYNSEKEDIFQQQVYPLNDPSIPRPQHPLTQPQQKLPPEGTVQSFPQKPPTAPDYAQPRPQGPDMHPMTPPPRNQRVRQPPEQQVVPRPQHPGQPGQDILHYPQDIFKNINAHPADKAVIEPDLAPDKYREHQTGKTHPMSKQTNGGQPYAPENVRNGTNHFAPDVTGRQHFVEHELVNQEEIRRQDHLQKQVINAPECLPHDRNIYASRQQQPVQTRQPQLDNDKNGLYVSLSEAAPPTHHPGHANHEQRQQPYPPGVLRNDVGPSPSPPATLPRTKPPEVPQPANRSKREKPTANQATLPRTGTNPFRTDTNPFRRESLPAEALDAGEYVMVAPRRGSLDDRTKPAHDHNRINEMIKPTDPSARHKDRRLEQQDSFEKPKNGSEGEDFLQMHSSYNRHLDEEHRQNVINSGISGPPEPGSRRQLPAIDKQPQKKQAGMAPPYAEQSQTPPVPKARTSLPETSTFGESRNGIPRTVPLTSLTLQQQKSDQQVGLHLKQSDDLGEKEKSAINDLSQHRHESGQQGFMRQDHSKQREDLVHPNIVDHSAFRNGDMSSSSSSKQKPPPTQPRKRVDVQAGSDLYRGKQQIQPGWPESSHDQRKSKPMHPSDNMQDMEGYQDEEEEEDIDDYFQMIENAITDRKPQVIVGGRKTSDIQRQLFNKELDRDHSKAGGSDYSPQKGQQVSATLRQIEAYNQNQQAKSATVKEKNDLNNMYEPEAKVLSSKKKDFYGVVVDEDEEEEDYPVDRKDAQYIIQPSDPRAAGQQDEWGKTKREHGKAAYDKLLLHELTPDTRQPSAKHYLEEHKTQPVSYEAFSSAKAMQQVQTDPRQQQYISQQQQKPYHQQGKETDSRNQGIYYYSQSSSSGSSGYQVSGQPNDAYDGNDLQKDQSSDPSKPSAIDLQNQKKAKPKPDPQDWSPVSDLSPILDVSPSIEAAEQELMEKFQEKVVDDHEMDNMVDDEDSRLLKAGGIPRAKSGTISGMLEEFTRALGLPGTSPIDDSGIKLAVSPTSLAMSPISNVGSSVTAVSSIQKEYQEGFGSPQKSTTSGSPQKTPAQPTTPRRSHRRLPQPTVEQMQAAVAMAAQGPRDKAQQPASSTTTTGAALFGVEAVAASNKGGGAGRPVSPVQQQACWKSPEMNQSFEQAYKQQGQPPQETPTTVPPSPAPRAQPRSGNNIPKSNDVTQTTSLATTQEVPPIQVRRLRSASYGGSPSSKPADDIVARLNGGGLSSPHGPNNVFSEVVTTSAGSPQTPSTPRDKTGDSSDTQSEAESIKSVRLRRKLPNLPQDQRSSPSPTRKTLERSKNGIELQDPNELEGLTPASAVTVTTTVATNLETSRQYSPLTALGTPSPQPAVAGGSLSPLLGRRAELARTPSPGGEAGTKLPQYMQSLKQQLRDELKAVTEERKVMLEQRGKEQQRGAESEGAKTPQPLIAVQQPSTEAKEEDGETAVTPQPPLSPYRSTTPSSHSPQSKSHPMSYQSPMFPHSQVPTTPQSTPQHVAVASQPQYQTQIMSPYRTQVSPHLYQASAQQQQQSQTPYQAQTYAQQEQFLYQALREGAGGGGRRTPLPDAVPSYASTPHRAPDDDITIMTTATTTVVSASEQWHDGRRHRQQPPTTTVAPSVSSVESLRRLQSKMSPQPSPKKGRRRHTSEITVPPFPQLEQHHEMAHTLHHPPRQQQQQQQQQQQPQQQQYIQYYTQIQGQNAAYRTMEFKSVDSHVRGTTDLLRSSGGRYGGSLGSGLGSTEALYQGRRVLNNKLQDYMVDNRIMEQQQRLVGPDAYFQTLNNEINRLRRSSESLHRDTIYDKPIWGGPNLQTQAPAVETRTSPQTTERRKRKEKKSRKPRSWHPSPYVSEDEDDQLTREEKKAKIKAEIARRRQQIEENVRLHDELCKLAERRDRMETTGRTGLVGYVPSPTGSVSYMAQEPPQPARTAPDGDDTSSVLKAIDEILRKDLYSGPLSRSAWATYASPAEARANDYYQPGYLTMPARGRYEYAATQDMRNSASWYEEEAALQQQQQQQQMQQQHQQQMQQQHQQQMQQQHFQQQMQQQQQYFPEQPPADPETAMDESIARIASTFPTDEPPDILLSSTPGHFSPEVTPAMPLLPDMPTRSRKLLENLGSSPIQPSRSGSAQSLYQERSGDEECPDDGSLGHRMQESSSLLRTQQRKTSRTPVSKTMQKYEFPVKRILLTRDPKDRSVSGNGLGMKVVGGKEVPGSNGMIGAYVAKIFPGGVVETLGEVKEGDQVLEWNGIPLTGRTYEEVQRIIASSADEVEIVIRCDLNMLETMSRQRRSSPGMGTSGGPRGEGSGGGGPTGRGPSPAHSPYSPSPRGQSPALSKQRGGGGGGGPGGNVIGVTSHGGVITSHGSLSETSSYENLQTPDQGMGGRLVRGLPNTAPTSRSVVSVFAPSADWPDIYDSAIYSAPQSPDDFLQDNFQNNWQSGSNIEEMQFQVCCGPRTAIVYVPIVPVRPMIKNMSPALLNRNHLTRRSVDHIDDYEPLLKNGWRTSEKTLGFYDLLRPRNSLGKVSLYLNGIKEKAEQYDLRKKNGMCRVTEIKEEEHRERPRAPSDLPGLRPVFVNDWKGHKKSKHEENDDNNNTKTSSHGEKPRKPCVGSSPEATPYNILPKGCRGSFCVIL